MSTERLEAAALDLLEQGDYHHALLLIETRLSLPEPPLPLVPSYVLCLLRTGATERAQVAAAALQAELARLDDSPRKKQLQQLLRAAVSLGAPRPVAPSADPHRLFGGPSAQPTPETFPRPSLKGA